MEGSSYLLLAGKVAFMGRIALVDRYRYPGKIDLVGRVDIDLTGRIGIVG